jgi:hypothetical protein
LIDHDEAIADRKPDQKDYENVITIGVICASDASVALLTYFAELVWLYSSSVSFHDGSHSLLQLPHLLHNLASPEDFLFQKNLEEFSKITILPARASRCAFASSVPISFLLWCSNTIFVAHRCHEYR